MGDLIVLSPPILESLTSSKLTDFSVLYKLLFSRGFYFREFREPDLAKIPLQFMYIYSNDNIRKIAKLTTRELPQKSKNAKITVRENTGLYSILKEYMKNI